MTSTITSSVTVRVSPDTAFEEWLSFELFPHFDLEPVSLPPHWSHDDEVQWTSGHDLRRAFITDYRRGERIAWAANEYERGVQAGIVTFTPTAEQGTEISVQLEYQPGGVLEHLRTAVGTVSQQVQDVLERFRDHTEPLSRGDLGEASDPIDELSDISERPAGGDEEWRGVGRRSDTGVTE
jgi:uncharacterized membrane protein